MSLKSDYLNPAHPKIRSLAKELGTLEKIHAYAAEKIDYGYGKSVLRELKIGRPFAIKTDLEALEDREGGCVEKSFLMASLARAMGKNFRFILHDSEGRGQQMHFEENSLVIEEPWDHLCCYYKGRVYDSIDNETWKLNPKTDTLCKDDYNIFMELQTQANDTLLSRFLDGEEIKLLRKETGQVTAKRSGSAVIRECKTSRLIMDAFVAGKRMRGMGDAATKQEIALMESTEPIVKRLSTKIGEQEKDCSIGYA